jgi:hypothetical protein
MGKLTRVAAASLVLLLVLASARLRAEVLAVRFEGRPQFKEGNALGYFVWREDGKWKLRWTTFGALHQFNGRIVVEGGEIKSFKRIDADEKSRIVAPGRAGRVVRGPRGRVVGTTPGRPPVVQTREQDHIEQESEHVIRFATRTDDDSDGLDFEVTPGTQRLRLFLQIEGETRPAEIEVGRNNFQPREDPLVIVLR